MKSRLTERDSACRECYEYLRKHALECPGCPLNPQGCPASPARIAAKLERTADGTPGEQDQ